MNMDLNSIIESPLSAVLRQADNSTISFGLGKPDTSMLPYQEMNRALSKTNLSPHQLQYNLPPDDLLAVIAELMKIRGINCKKDQILLTSGAQEAINLLAEMHKCNKGKVICDQLVYPGYQQVINRCGLKPLYYQNSEHTITFPYTKNNHKITSMYCVSVGNNPTGLSLSQQNRVLIIDYLKQHDIPLIEDDAYGFISDMSILENMPILSNKDINGYYVGTFSKIIAPSLRIGWIVAEESIITQLYQYKESTNLNISTLSQYILLNYLNSIDIHAHLRRVAEHYANKRALILEYLQRYMPEYVHYTHPTAGFFIWLTLPNHIATQELLKVSIREYGVNFIPGSAFTNNRNFHNCLRLSYSHLPIEYIESGIKKLAVLIKNIVGYNC